MKNTHQDIKVIISDLDGTLLNSNHEISSKTKAVFEQLHRNGYRIIVATGRHHIDARAVLKNLNIPLYLVSSNGARIHDSNDKLLYSIDIKSEVIASVFKLDIDYEITTVLFKEKVWLVSKTNKKINNFQKDLSYPPEIVDFEKLTDLSAIKLFFTHDDHDRLVALKDKIMATHSGSLCSAFSLPFCLEFMDKSVDKSVAIEKILKREGYSFANTIAFGDGFNDEKMLVAASKGLIMQNAPDSLKKELNHLKVIGLNYQDGVAAYLEAHFL